MVIPIGVKGSCNVAALVNTGSGTGATGPSRPVLMPERVAVTTATGQVLKYIITYVEVMKGVPQPTLITKRCISNSRLKLEGPA